MKLHVWKRKEIEGTIIDWLLGAEKLGETKFYEFVPSHLVKRDKSLFKEKQAFVSQKRSSFPMKPIFLSTLSDKISTDKSAENFPCWRKFCPPKYFVRRNFVQYNV